MAWLTSPSFFDNWTQKQFPVLTRSQGMWSSGVLIPFCLAASSFSCFPPGSLSLERRSALPQLWLLSDWCIPVISMAALPSRLCRELLIYSVYPWLSLLHTPKAALSKFYLLEFHSVLHLCLFWSGPEHVFCPPPACIYRHWALTPKAPFCPDQTQSWAAQSLHVTPQTISSSAGGVHSAKVLLRHCAVKLPLLHLSAVSAVNVYLAQFVS